MTPLMGIKYNEYTCCKLVRYYLGNQDNEVSQINCLLDCPYNILLHLIFFLGHFSAALVRYQNNEYERKTWKGQMIKNMLTRRKESVTYLATVSRHRWSRQIAMKIDKIL